MPSVEISTAPISISDFLSKKGILKFIEIATTLTYTQPQFMAALVLNGCVRHTNLVVDTLVMRQPAGEAVVDWPLWAEKVLAAVETGNEPLFQKGWTPCIIPPGFRLYFEGDQDVFITLLEIDTRGR